ncbi:MAG: C45 family autoproteolytic acyltransferase/hydrolase [Halanaerobiales bacterium]
MKVIECEGDFKEIGRKTGEELREEIRQMIRVHLSGYSKREEEWKKRLPVFIKTLKKYMPEVKEEMDGMAEGANLPEEEIYKINIPLYEDSLSLKQGCTNIGFKGGPQGNILGKNNDMGNPVTDENAYPYVLRIVKPNQGIPYLTLTFCGMLSTLDTMNAEGVTTGHSSVGSIYQKSDYFPVIRLWGYKILKESRNLKEYVNKFSSVPLRGKGYTFLAMDRDNMVAVEAPCPMVQVRHPNHENGINCVNYYQLPYLYEVDNRSVIGKENCLKRREHLENVLEEGGVYDIERMKSELKYHSTPGVCRHGGEHAPYTTFSMIGVPQENKLLYLEGYPCENNYEEVVLS